MVENMNELGERECIKIFDDLNVGFLRLLGNQSNDTPEPEGGFSFEIKRFAELGQKSRNSQHDLSAKILY
jgi:hypothetical protein